VKAPKPTPYSGFAAKTCKLCGLFLPPTKFHILGGRRLHSYCKWCVSNRSMELRSIRIERARAAAAEPSARGGNPESQSSLNAPRLDPADERRPENGRRRSQ